MLDYADLDRLAEAAQAGDIDAVDALSRKGYALVAMIVYGGGYWLPGREGDEDDLIQEGMLGFLQAVRDWRPGLQPFKGFAAMCVRRNLMEALNRVHRKCRRAHVHALSLDSPVLRNAGGADHDGDGAVEFKVADESGLGLDPADLVVECEVPMLLTVLGEHLTALEREVMIRFCCLDQEYRTIAAALGITLKGVDNALQRIRRKLSKRIGLLTADERLSDELRDQLRYAVARYYQRRRKSA